MVRLRWIGLMIVAAGCPDDGGGDGDSGTTAAADSGTTAGAMTTAPATETGSADTAGPTTSGADSTTGADSTMGSDSGDTGSTGSGGSGSSSGSTGADSGSSSGDGSSSSTGEPLEEIDCAEIPTVAESFQLINGPRGYHGLVITDEGMMIGSDGVSLIQSDYAGAWSVFIPGTGNGEQMDLLPDGDIVFNGNSGNLERIGLDATIQVIHPGVNAYGATVGIDGMVYVVDSNFLDRIDPVTGIREALFTAPNFTSLHSMGFSPDGHRAYVGTIGGDGNILYADFDEEMEPISTQLDVFTTGVSEGSTWHDAVAVDACGNLYVPNFWSRNMFRITPDGQVNEFWDPGQNNLYGHGTVWGNGVDGWDPEALYVPQPYNNNTVTEVVVGLPGRDYAGPVVNAIPMDPPPPMP